MRVASTLSLRRVASALESRLGPGVRVYLVSCRSRTLSPSEICSNNGLLHTHAADNGSVRAASTLSLRRVASALESRLGPGVRVYPVSCRFSNRVRPEDLGGVPADILTPLMRRLAEDGITDFLVCVWMWLHPLTCVFMAPLMRRVAKDAIHRLSEACMAIAMYRPRSFSMPLLMRRLAKDAIHRLPGA